MCAARIAVHFIDSDSDQHLEQEPRSPIPAPVEMSVLRSTLDVCSLIRFVFACSYVTDRIWLRRVYAVCDSEYIYEDLNGSHGEDGRREKALAWEIIYWDPISGCLGLPRYTTGERDIYSNI